MKVPLLKSVASALVLALALSVHGCAIKEEQPGRNIIARINSYEMTEEDFRQRLYAPDMHDPELLIRTSGEQRISNYLLWQCAYSEFVFRDELWPDFDREAFSDSLAEFGRRERRFGTRAG